MCAETLILSFARRIGRTIGSTKKQLLAELLPIYAIEQYQPIEGPLWVEIGSGGGEHIAAQAKLNPDINFIACEPYLNGVANLLQIMQQENITNIKIWIDDARLLLKQMPDHSIDKLFVLFPDPWPKTKHYKRRIIAPATLELFSLKMTKQAKLVVATDHADYANWILFHLQQSSFTLSAKNYQELRNEPTNWVQTKYQQKAEEQGLKPYFFVATSR